ERVRGRRCSIDLNPSPDRIWRCDPTSPYGRGGRQSIAGEEVATPPARRYNTSVHTEPPMQDLWRLPAPDLAPLAKSKKVSAKEAATDALARLDAVNPGINAVVDHRPDDVLKQAAEVDAKIAHGEDAGLLAGVPVTVKVNIDQQGFASTNGL